MLDAVFECTLDMINKDLEAFPEHRTNFFQFLNAITRHCFKVLLALPDPVFGLVIQAIVWAFKHSMRNVAETGELIFFKRKFILTDDDDDTIVSSAADSYDDKICPRSKLERVQNYFIRKIIFRSRDSPGDVYSSG